MHTDGVAPQLPAQLTDGLHEGSALNVADGASDLRDDKIQVFALLVLTQHSALDLVRDVRHHLDGLPQIVTVALAVDDGLVDAARRDGVVARGADARETLVVAQVEIGLHAIFRDVTLAVLIGVERAGIDVDVGVELLNGDLVAARLQQLADAGGDDAFAQRGNHAARDEDEFCFHRTIK